MISLGNLESAEKSQKASIITDEEDSYDLQKELEAKFDDYLDQLMKNKK